MLFLHLLYFPHSIHTLLKRLRCDESLCVFASPSCVCVFACVCLFAFACVSGFCFTSTFALCRHIPARSHPWGMRRPQPPSRMPAVWWKGEYFPDPWPHYRVMQLQSKHSFDIDPESNLSLYVRLFLAHFGCLAAPITFLSFFPLSHVAFLSTFFGCSRVRSSRSGSAFALILHTSGMNRRR